MFIIMVDSRNIISDSGSNIINLYSKGIIQMKDLQKLSTKHLQMIEYEIEHPAASQAEIARQFHISTPAMCHIYHSPVYEEAKAKRLKEVWKDSVKIAQNTMVRLAEEGDRQAAQFILQTNNYAPEQSVDVTASLINVNIV